MFRYADDQMPDWNRLDPLKFEGIVTTLLKRLHPAGQRIDGSGGDRGMDFVVGYPPDQHVFQLKCFPGRLNASRRRQIEASLRSVSVDATRAWTLVIPTNPTPAERDWLESLRRQVPFPIDWLCLDWIESTLADDDAVRFAMLGDAGAVRAEIADLLSRVGNPIVSVHDWWAAQERLVGVASMLSPRFDLLPTIGPNGPQVRIEPKSGQEPLTVDINAMRAVLDDDAWERFIWGGQVEFYAAPSEMGLPHGLLPYDSGSWNVRGGSTPPFGLRLEAIKHGRRVAELDFPPQTASVGPAGIELRVADRTGWVQARIRLTPQPPLDLTISVSTNGDAYPDDAVQTIGFLETLHTAEGIRSVLITPDGDEARTHVTPRSQLEMDLAPPEWFAPFVRDVKWLQDYCDVRHRISCGATPEDVIEIARLVSALQGNVVQFDGELTLTGDQWPAEVPDSAVPVRVSQTLEAFQLREAEYRFNSLRQEISCERATIVNRDEIVQAGGTGSPCSIKLRPVDGELWSLTVTTVDERLPPGDVAA